MKKAYKLLLGVTLLLFLGWWLALQSLPPQLLMVSVDGEAVTVWGIRARNRELWQLALSGEDEIAASDDRGQWPLGSLFRFGLKEGSGGELLVRSIAKNYAIPVYWWGGEGWQVFWETPWPLRWLRVGGLKNDNLPWADKIRLVLFGLSPQKTSWIRQYQALDSNPTDMALIHGCRSSAVISSLSELLRSGGYRLSYLQFDPAIDIDSGCTVSSFDKSLGLHLAALAGQNCRWQKGEPDGGVELRVSAEFCRRF